MQNKAFNPLKSKTITFKTNKAKKKQESTTRSCFLSSFKALIRHKQILRKRKWTKQHWILLKKRILTTIIKAEMKLALRKKLSRWKKSYFQSIICLHALKLALNKNMRAYDDEQGINKLWPLFNWTKVVFKKLIYINSSLDPRGSR